MPNKGVRFAFYGAWALALTGLTYVLGALPLKVLRTWMGRGAYWSAGFALSSGLLVAPAPLLNQLGFAFLSLLVLIGTFAELEEMGLDLPAAAFFTLLIDGLVAGAMFALWVSAVGGAGWFGTLTATLERVLKPVTEINPALHFDYASLVAQLPSIVVILWMVALYLAVLGEARLGGRPGLRDQLGEYRNPDGVTWVFMAALLGAFGNFVPPQLAMVAANALNVCLLLFFFQGIAVVTRYLTSYRMRVGAQAVLMIVILLHLFWFVSLIGLSDHWLDFRERLRKRSATV